jgi:hypothetical protein
MSLSRTIPLAGALIALGCLIAVGALLGLGAPATADAQSAKRIGNTSFVPRPACPQNTMRRPCEAVGSVTGFQVVGQGRRGLMQAREDGHLVAWGIRLSRPTSRQQRFFGDFYESTRFGTRPHARIAILRRTTGREYRLVRQSPPVDITRGLGSRQIYTLTQPLRIREGQILALTIPSWAPAFAVNLPPRRNIWRASRMPNRCTGARNIEQSRPHQRAGSTRRYGCTYRTARLLYWGLYAPQD